jgi:hypothetical protein
MPSAPVEPFLHAWRTAVRENDARLLAPWIAEDVRFSSPAAFRPMQGRERVVALLADVLASISNYCVTKTWIDGAEILLEFEASVGKRSVQGIDRITLDGDGRLTQLAVYIRPFSGLRALMTAVADRQLRRLALPRRILARTRAAVRVWM